MVSVIIPIYKVEQYLRECVDSVLAQTYSDLEIILIDDGSPDVCGAICDEYAASDKRVRVIHQQNKGLSGARNAGLDIAAGEYIVFVDSDDYIKPDMVEKLHAHCKAYDADIVCCTNMHKKGDKISLSPKRPRPDGDMEIYEGLQALDAYIRDRRMTTAVWAKMYKAELFKKIRFPEGRLYEDGFVIHLLMYGARRTVNISYAGYIYRKRSNSITSAPFSMSQTDLIENRFRQLEFVRSVRPELEPYAVVNMMHCSRKIIFLLASDKKRHRDIEKKLQSMYRENIFTFVRHVRSAAVAAFGVLTAVSVPAARLAALCFLKLIRR